jgi:Stage II sporulation protein M
VNILRALSRARLPIVTVAATYLFSVLLGVFMVHSQNHFALAHRDKLVGDAQQSSTLTQRNVRHPFRAAVLDFAGNLVAGISSTVSGLCVPLAYPMVAYRGWVGGIVSVDGDHKSRFAHPRTALYYVVVLLMQILPYSLAGGAGVNVGISLFRASVRYSGPRWWIFPLEPLHDAARIYILVVPLFLIASLVEFYFV